MAEPVVYCPRCGTRRLDGMAFCPRCGLALDEVVPATGHTGTSSIGTVSMAAAHAGQHPAAGGSDALDNLGLGIALLAVVGIFVVLMGGMTALNVNQAFAGPIAALPLGFIAPIHREIRARLLRRRLGPAAPAAPRVDRSYAIAPTRLAVYATLILVAVLNAGSFVGGLIGSALTANVAAAIVAGIAGGTTATIVVAYVVGRWIGARAERAPVVTLLVVCVAAQILAILVDLAFLPFLGVAPAIAIDVVLLLFALHVIPWAVAGLVGVWLGSATRWKSELGHVARLLPPERREELLTAARSAGADG